MTCRSCLASSDLSDRFCRQCGLALGRPCPRCGEWISQLETERHNCADTQTPSSSNPPTARLRGIPEFLFKGERKFLTVMFADIVGSTALVEGLDPEQSGATLQPAIELMVDAVRTYGGTVNRVAGDGIMALFGAPVSHEDHALRACLAGLMLVAEAGKVAGRAVPVRVGLHSGLVVVRAINTDMSVSYDASGPAVHLAARMEQLGPPGAVHASAATHALVAGAVIAEPLGPQPVPGFSKPVESFLVTGIAGWARAPAARRDPALNPFVGREHPLAALRTAAGRALLSGTQSLLVSGFAGIGKSRLVGEFVDTVLEPDWLVLRAACLPFHQNTTYYAFRRLLQYWIEPDRTGPSPSRADGLAAALLRLDPALLDDLTPLRALLGPVKDRSWDEVEPAARRVRIAEALVRLLATLTRAQPVALVLEDMHWADAESVRLARLLSTQMPHQHCLVLLTSREPDPAFPAPIELHALSGSETQTLLDALLGPSRRLDPLKRQLRQRTGGVPLFIEEIVRSLAATGDLAGASGGYEPQGPLHAIRLPDRLNTLLSSRLDQVDRPLKFLLQVCAVIGQEVSAPILARVIGWPEISVLEQLAKLCRMEFVLEEADGSAGLFSFRHSLLREAAYESLLTEQRIVLHGAVVEAIESHFGNAVAQHVESLAQHAALGELWPKGAAYARVAAERAAQRSALQDACRFLELALLCIGKLPQDRGALARTAELNLMLRLALWPLGRVSEADACLVRAESIAGHLDDQYRLAQIQISRTQILNSEGDLDRALKSGQLARDRAARVGDLALRIGARFVLAQTLQFRGDFREVIATLEPEQTELMGGLRHRRLLSNTTTTSVQHLAMLSRAHSMLGAFDTGAALATEAVAIARAVNRGFDIGFALQAAGAVALLRGDRSAATTPLEEALAICEAEALDMLYPLVASPLGLIYAASDNVAKGLRLLDNGIAAASKGRLVFYHTWATALYARAALEGGASVDIDALRQNLSVAIAHRYAWIEAWLRHSLGALLDRETPGSGIDLVREGARLAASLGMRPELARCHWTLSGLYARLGHPAAEDHRLAASALMGELGMVHPAILDAAPGP